MYLAEYQNQISLFKNRGTISSGIMGSFTSSNSPLYQGVHQIKNFAPYVQADLRFQKLSLSLGYRFEYFELDGKSEQASIIRTGLNYELTKATFLRASFGQGFRFPSIAERFITTSVGLLNVFANPELSAEKGWSSELAIKQGFKLGNQFSGFVDVAAFWTQYQNMIEFNFGLWKILPNVFDGIGFKAVNVGETRITGLDFVVGTDGKIGAFTIRSLIGYTYTKPVSLDPDFIFARDSFAATYSHKTTSEDTTNNLLKYRYTHLFKYDIEVGYKKWMFGISQRYNSYMTNVDGAFVKPIVLNIYIVPEVERGRAMNPNGDLITDIRVGYKLNTKLNFQFLVNNITNHEQMTRPGDLRPPRMFLFQVQYALQ
jgi:iron complex outermembrane receptor protein